MNILLLNPINPYVASGSVTLNLFNDLKRNGHNVRLLTNSYNSNYPEDIVSMESSFISFWKQSWIRHKCDGFRKRLKLNKVINTDKKFDFFEFHEKKMYYKTSTFLKKAKIKPDITIILFAKGFINIKNIYELQKYTNSKIFWLMYDMAPLTGGCHYAFDCKGYLHKCGNCPGILSSDSFDITYNNFAFKKKYLDLTNVQLIAGSEWQYRQAKMSSLFKNQIIHKILLPIDPNIFKPLNKAKLRQDMGIPINKKVILFGSVELSTIRKGMQYLLKSLKILKEKVKNTAFENDILLLIAGNRIETINNDLPFEYKYLGMLNNKHGIASAYQSADFFVCPSIEDSGPTMINQSIMCGTPVVSFEMGVSLDLVLTGKTGYRAKLKDCDDLAEGLYYLLTLDNDEYQELSTFSRNLAIELCLPEVQIKQLENIFKKN